MSKNSTFKKHILILSQREKEIIYQLANGLKYREISEKLFISTETVRTHIRNLYKKLHVNSRTEAVNKVFGKRNTPE